MESVSVELLKLAASKLRGVQHRLFLADVCSKVCAGSARRAEAQFGWGRNTISKGLEERLLSPKAAADRKRLKFRLIPRQK